MRTEPMINPMDEIFPKLTSCVYTAFGKSGSRQTYNGQCLISLNILNEKIFFFLWLFYVLLTSAFVIKLFHSLLYIFPSVRLTAVLGDLNLSPKQSELLQRNLSPGDLFVLMRMKDNITPSTFRLFIQIMIKDFKVEQFGWKDGKTHEKILQENVDLEDGLLTGNRLIAKNAKEFGWASLANMRNNCKISRRNNNDTGNYYRSGGWAYQNHHQDRRHTGNGNARLENEYQDSPGGSQNGHENEYQDVIKRSNDHVQVDVEKN